MAQTRMSTLRISMKTYTQIFQYLSYLQYPLMILALYFCYKPIILGMENIWADFNNGLILMGLAISFSTLQDPTKTQNKLSRIVYENPKYSRYFIIYMLILTLVIMGFGSYGYFFSEIENIKEISFGFIVLGIGMISMVKMALEMAKYHNNKLKSTDD